MTSNDRRQKSDIESPGIGCSLCLNCFLRFFLSKSQKYILLLGKSIHLEPFDDPCFDWKRPCFGGAKAKYRGQTGSR